jgi:hypothetical protein
MEADIVFRSLSHLLQRQLDATCTQRRQNEALQWNLDADSVSNHELSELRILNSF